MRPLSRRRIPVWATLVPIAYIAGILAVRLTSGPIAAWALGIAGAGLVLVIAVVMLTAGYSVVHHAERERRAIAAIEASRRRRELTR